MPKYTVMLARFPGGYQECPESTEWCMKTILQMRQDPRIENVFSWWRADTPIPMVRNLAVREAIKKGVDYLLMIDSDMAPDCEVGVDPDAKPFWPTAFDLALAANFPCVIGAPYCGPPPHENVYVFQWTTHESNTPYDNGALIQFSRNEAAQRVGIEEVAALPTGLILFDMRAFKMLPSNQPYFDYEYTDGWETKKATTEDVFTTRNLSMLGVPQLVLWDSWAGHVKRKIVGKPVINTIEQVAESLREPLVARRSINDRVINLDAINKLGIPISMALPNRVLEVQSETSTAVKRDHPKPPWDRDELVGDVID
jgi:hypothetical protein